MLKYIIKNIKQFYRTDRTVFLIIQLCAFLSGIMLCFSYGIYRNYQAEQLAWGGNCELQIRFSGKREGKTGVTKQELDECLQNLPDWITRRIECIFVDAWIDGNLSTECRFTVKNGKTAICETFMENLLKNNMADVYFSEAQEENGDAVALLYKAEHASFQNGLAPGQEQDGYVELQGRKYRVIGTQSWTKNSVLVPWASLDGSTLLDDSGVSLIFDTAYTEPQYRKIAEIFTQKMGAWVRIPPMEEGAGSPKKLAWTMIAAAVLISASIAGDFSLLYLYILEKRKRRMRIFLLCGMDRRRVMKMYLAECMICIVPLFLAGMLFFHFGIMPKLYAIYPYMDGVFSMDVYLVLVFLFLAVSGAVLGTTVIPELIAIL